jgi:hypothetical protein
MGKKAKNGANKKLHNKLFKQKKTKEQESKDHRKKLMRELNQKSDKRRTLIAIKDTEVE